MNLIYESFETYQSAMNQAGEWDSTDAVINLYHRCRKHPRICRSFELDTLAIDEVQDMVSLFAL